MKENQKKVGIVISLTGIILGLVSLYLFATSYNHMIQVEISAGRPDEARVVQLVFPILSYLATAGTAIWAAGLYGFIVEGKWAWMTAFLASTLHVLAGFFPTIPALSRGETPVMVLFFLPALLLWFGLLFMRKVNWKIVSLAFTAGLAMVLAFMNGVAAIDKIQLTSWAMQGKPLMEMAELPRGYDVLNGMYVMVQQVNWASTAVWLAFIYGLLGKKPWTQRIGITAGVLGVIGGLPLAVSNILEVKRFSMFVPSPLLSMGLIVVLVWSETRRMLQTWSESKTINNPAAGNKKAALAAGGRS